MSHEKQTTVRGAPAALETWIQTLSGVIAEGWSRGTEIERKVHGKRNVRWPICLIWSGEGRHPRTAIFLQSLSESEIGVMSLVALDQRELAPEDRIAALRAFQAALVAPKAEELKVAEKSVSLELPEIISPSAVGRFVTFVKTANKTHLHPGLDLPRWYDFLIQLHRDGSRPPREILEKALKDAAFSEDLIRHLLDAFDSTDELLCRYDTFGECG